LNFISCVYMPDPIKKWKAISFSSTLHLHIYSSSLSIFVAVMQQFVYILIFPSLVMWETGIAWATYLLQGLWFQRSWYLVLTLIFRPKFAIKDCIEELLRWLPCIHVSLLWADAHREFSPPETQQRGIEI
jgi:hypothetical protein